MPSLPFKRMQWCYQQPYAPSYEVPSGCFPSTYKSGRYLLHYWSKTIKRVKPVGGRVLYVEGFKTIETRFEAGIRNMTRHTRHWEQYLTGPFYHRVGDVAQYSAWVSQNPYTTSTVSSGSVQNLALSKLREAVKDQKCSLLVDLAEARMTATMFESMLSTTVSVIRGINALKNIVRTGTNLAETRKALRQLSRIGKNLWDSVPSNWLLYRYGATPLAYTALGLAESLANIQDHPTIWKRVEGRKVIRDYVVTPDNKGPYSRFYAFRFTDRCKAICFIRPNTAPTASVTSKARQLGLSNPFGAAYDLIPFSFVLDWFTNIGDVLNGLDATLGLGEVRGWTLEKDIKQHLYLGSVTYEYYWRERIPFSGLPNAVFAFGPSMTLNRATDVLAFATSIMQGASRHPPAPKKFAPPIFRDWPEKAL